MDIYDILKGNVIVRRHCVVQKMGAGRAGVLLCPVTWRNSQKLVLCLASVYRQRYQIKERVSLCWTKKN